MSIEYDVSRNEEAVKNVIRKFSADEILKSINRELSAIFNGKSDIPGTERVAYQVVNRITKKKNQVGLIIQSWGLLDLAYYTVLFTNDHRGKAIENKSELFLLYNAVDDYKQQKKKLNLHSFNNESSDILLYIF